MHSRRGALALALVAILAAPAIVATHEADNAYPAWTAPLSIYNLTDSAPFGVELNAGSVYDTVYVTTYTDLMELRRSHETGVWTQQFRVSMVNDYPYQEVLPQVVRFWAAGLILVGFIDTSGDHMLGGFWQNGAPAERTVYFEAGLELVGLESLKRSQYENNPFSLVDTVWALLKDPAATPPTYQLQGINYQGETLSTYDLGSPFTGEPVSLAIHHDTLYVTLDGDGGPAGIDLLRYNSSHAEFEYYGNVEYPTFTANGRAEQGSGAMAIYFEDGNLPLPRFAVVGRAITNNQAGGQGGIAVFDADLGPTHYAAPPPAPTETETETDSTPGGGSVEEAPASNHGLMGAGAAALALGLFIAIADKTPLSKHLSRDRKAAKQRIVAGIALAATGLLGGLVGWAMPQLVGVFA